MDITSPPIPACAHYANPAVRHVQMEQNVQHVTLPLSSTLLMQPTYAHARTQHISTQHKTSVSPVTLYARHVHKHHQQIVHHATLVVHYHQAHAHAYRIISTMVLCVLHVITVVTVVMVLGLVVV